MTFKVVVSDKENSYQIESNDSINKQIVGLTIGEDMDGKLIGLEGYKLKITGGSDKNGFPMKKDIDSSRRVKSLVSGGIGYKPKADGVRRRKSFRGNTISEDIVQINTVVSETGNKSINEILSPSQEESEE
ncbi:MAG: 30S ribosomal protein S6e [Methanobrevibacter sp.]|nr:30S ribosomal protein S6e [Candidatus Methanovirga basalitermitum]